MSGGKPSSRTDTQPTTRPPWGVVAGLLASCVATLAGAAANVDPDVVLLRALQAGLAVAATWTAGRLLFVTVLAVTKR